MNRPISLIFSLPLLFLVALGCGEKVDGEPGPNQATEAKSSAAKPAAPAKSANPYVTRYQTIWPEIDKCKASSLYSEKACPKGYALSEEGKKVKSAWQKAINGDKPQPKEWTLFHEAMMDHVLRGKGDVSRSFAARVSSDVGDFVKKDEKLAMQLLDVYEKGSTTSAVLYWGYGIATLVDAFWESDNKVRKRMLSLIANNKAKSYMARKQMIDRQRLFFKVRGHKAFSSTYEKIIADKADNAYVRNEAVLSYSDGVAKEPARGDLLMQIAADKSDERSVRRAALYGLSELRSEDAAARRKQAADLIVKLVTEELDQFGSAAPERLAPIGSAKHLQKLIAIDTANKSEASGNMLAHAVRSFGKQKHMQGKGGAKAMAKAAKAVFKGKGASYIKPYAFDGIVAFGGKKMRAICKTLEKDPDAGIAGKAKNCVKSLSKK